jgi:hypothetical protein
LTEVLNESVSGGQLPGEPLRMIQAVMKDRTVDIGFDVVVVLIGRLNVRDGVTFWKSHRGKITGNGYGVDGFFPAEVSVERFLKIEGPVSRYSRNPTVNQ